MNKKVSDREIEELGERFSKRYILKKKVNAFLCFFIAFCGTSAVLYSRFIFGNPLFDRLRYMTFWGTLFTSATAFVFGIVCVMEAARETEVTYRPVYYLRLSSATTEAVIIYSVMLGMTPLVSDNPDVSSYPGIMMHLVVPLTTVFATEKLPSEKAPYSFLDFENTTTSFKLICMAGIYAGGYFVSWLLMRLNMRLSWVWFYDMKRAGKKGKDNKRRHG